MRSEKFKYTKSDLERALKNAVRSQSSKPKRTTFDHFMNDAEVFRQNSKNLISFIEEKGSDEEKQKLFSGFLEMLLLADIFCSTEMLGNVKNEKRVSASRARDVRATTSQAIDKIISNRLSSLYSKHPIRRDTDEGAARDIFGQVNSDLEREQIKPLGVSAIRKRIKQIKMKMGTSGQSSS
jgi:hypothetical protein